MCLIQFLHPSLFFSSSWPSLRFWIALLLAGNPSQATHHVFSSFDTCVQKLNLFKMDTVGDAYIVAAWLTHEDDHDVRALSKLCHDILELAHCMLQTIEHYRSKGGYGISARIGISAGTVVVGALGSLQPRSASAPLPPPAPLT